MKLALSCFRCGRIFERERHHVKPRKRYFCSQACVGTHREVLTCANCQTKFQRRKSTRERQHHRLFCSQRCRIEIGWTAQDCRQCGIPFKSLRSRRSVYCSQECARLALNQSKKPALVELVCGQCSKQFMRFPSQVRKSGSDRVFCSMRCLGASFRNKVPRACNTCGALFSCHPSRLRSFCSVGCMVKWRSKDVTVIAKTVRTRRYPHSSIEEVKSYLTMKRATRKVEQCLIQTR